MEPALLAHRARWGWQRRGRRKHFWGSCKPAAITPVHCGCLPPIAQDLSLCRPWSQTAGVAVGPCPSLSCDWASRKHLGFLTETGGLLGETGVIAVYLDSSLSAPSLEVVGPTCRASEALLTCVLFPLAVWSWARGLTSLNLHLLFIRGRWSLLG